MLNFYYTATMGIAFQFGLKIIAILGTRAILVLQLGLFFRDSALLLFTI